jgi:ribose transport system permease protein
MSNTNTGAKSATATAKKSGSASGLMAYAGTFGALLILCVALAVASPNFLKWSNFMSILKQTSFNALVSTGMLLCLITAGIELSVGANATFCACVAGMLVQKGVDSSALMIIVAIVCGTLIGCINGTLLTRLHLPHPFVSTLGMKNVLWGAALLVTGSQMVSGFPNGVMWLGSATIGSFPISFIVVLIIYVIMHIMLTRTALGRSIYCAGGNMEATRLSGIDSANVLTFCYTVSGFMAALAGIVSIGRSGICNGANAIQPYDTDAIAACIIGGASFNGGKGTMLGTMLGALIIAVLRNGFTLLSVSSAVQNMVLGLVIIGAVLLDVTREQMAAKARKLAAK